MTVYPSLPLNTVSALFVTSYLTSAFIHPRLSSPPSQRHRPRSCNGSNEQEILSEITIALRRMQDDLLSNPPKLKPIKEQHQHIDHDREITTEKLVKETLLCSRLPFSLNRTTVATSIIPDAGRGLFASENIAKGELITCYPGDALLCEYQQEEQEEAHDDETAELEWEDDDDLEEIVLWGNHVSKNDRLDDDEVFDGTDEGLPPLVSYAASVDDVYSVMGMPSLDGDPAYYGHFANDGAGHVAFQKGDGNMGVEEMISLYVEKSLELSNARHNPLAGGLHLGTFATKNITKGDEILVTYGSEYWMDYEF